MTKGGGKLRNKFMKRIAVGFEIGAVIAIALRLIIDNAVIIRICNIEVLLTCIVHIAYYWMKARAERQQ